MKRASLLFGVCAAHTLLSQVVYSHKLDDGATFEKGIVKTCDALPEWDRLTGEVLTLLAPILCTKAKVLEIAGDVTIRSHAAIRTRDVMFYVRRGARLTFDAPSVTIERKSLEPGESILWVEGMVVLEVSAWPLDFPFDGSWIDQYNVAYFNYGSLESDGLIWYTPSSIIVVSSDEERQGRDEPIVLAPDSQEVLAGVHSRIDPARGSHNTGTATITTNTIEPPSGKVSTGVNKHERGRGDSKRSSNSGKKRRESLKVGQELTDGLGSSTSSAELYFNGTTGSLQFSKEIDFMPGEDDGHPTIPRLRQTTTLIQADPDKMKQVQERRERLAKESWKEDPNRMPFGDSRDKQWHSEKDTRKANKVLRILELLPHGKHGYRERQAREYARAHAGETYLTIDNKGTLEGIVDGTVVMQYRAPAWFFVYRTKDESYELRTTEDGLVVLRGGRPVWNIDAAEMWRRL